MVRICETHITGLSKNIVINFADKDRISIREFSEAVDQVRRSAIHYQMKPIYASADKALEIFTKYGIDANTAYNALRSSYGKLWYYSGD
jgi:hypothetical protein